MWLMDRLIWSCRGMLSSGINLVFDNGNVMAIKYLIVTIILFGTIFDAEAYLEFCNKRLAGISVAIMEVDEDDSDRWTTRGWFNISNGKCAKVLNYDLDNRYYYYYLDLPQTSKYENSKTSTHGCIREDKFKLDSDIDCASANAKQVDFQMIDTGNSSWASISVGMTDFDRLMALGATLKKSAQDEKIHQANVNFESFFRILRLVAAKNKNNIIGLQSEMRKQKSSLNIDRIADKTFKGEKSDALLNAVGIYAYRVLMKSLVDWNGLFIGYKVKAKIQLKSICKANVGFCYKYILTDAGGERGLVFIVDETDGIFSIVDFGPKFGDVEGDWISIASFEKKSQDGLSPENYFINEVNKKINQYNDNLNEFIVAR